MSTCSDVLERYAKRKKEKKKKGKTFGYPLSRGFGLAIELIARFLCGSTDSVYR